MELVSCSGSILPKVASVLAVGYAFYVLRGFWKKRLTAEAPATGELTTAGKIHVLLWTVGPPTWFFIEYWLASTYGCPGSKDALEDVKLWQDMAKPFWAGVLAAILFLKGK